MGGPDTVLLLAGDGFTRRITADGLAMYGHRVLLAKDGREALELLQAEPGGVGVIVADADLGDGLGVAGLARLLDPAIGVILTARSPGSVPERGRVGGALLLRSPYGVGEIVAAIAGLRDAASADPARRAA